MCSVHIHIHIHIHIHTRTTAGECGACRGGVKGGYSGRGFEESGSRGRVRDLKGIQPSSQLSSYLCRIRRKTLEAARERVRKIEKIQPQQYNSKDTLSYVYI